MTESAFLPVSFILFAIGVLGLVLRRDAITIFLAVEMMLNAANLAFVGFAKMHGNELGQVAALIVIAVAAAEAAIGLMLVISLKKHFGTLDLAQMRELRG